MTLNNSSRYGRVVLAIALLPLLILSTQAFGQSASTIGGTVMDASQAVLPGASVTATNTQTGITATTTSNNAGIYNFPSLQPGVYKMVAAMKGFQTATKTDVKLGMASQIRLNFELVVAGVETQVEISTSAENLVLEAGSSTGTVLQENTVTELPLASNDVMDLVNVLGGVVKAENPIFSNSTQTFAGVSGSNINIQRDGISVNEVRYTSGIVSPIRINPEMVGEFKMVLSPVDAEMGRGAGQVQMLTKSGSNAFHGSAVWNNQNTALDANEWYRNKMGTEPDWRNLNNYTLSASGPIIKNRTFFFASWDQQIARTKQVTNTKVLTNCARKGIYRYLDGWVNGNINVKANTAVVGSRTRPTVNADGTPAYSWTGPDVNGRVVSFPAVAMQYQSVFGQLTPEARAQIAADPVDCSQFNFSPTNTGVIAGTAWDTYRNGYDQSGYVQRFTDMMPRANNWESGDGLNLAGLQWVRTLKGSDTIFGSGEDNERKSVTVKIDHNLTNAHRVSGTYTFEKDHGDDAYPTWPEQYGGYGGSVDRKPQNFTVTLTSTLRPTLLNEFRFGLSRTNTFTKDPLNNDKSSSKLKAVLETLMPTSTGNFSNYNGLPLIIGAGNGDMLFGADTETAFYTSNSSHPYGSRGNLPATSGGVDPRWSLSDTMTWTRGAHSFKGGFEFRRASSRQESNGAGGFVASANTLPSVVGGVLSASPYAQGELARWGMEGSDTSSVTGNYTNAYNLLTYFSGSVGAIRQYFYINDAKSLTWNDVSNGEYNYITELRNKEFSFFFKDDWKVSNSLTLNLGMRYEYYGLPYVANGMTAALKGGSQSLFGISGGDFSTWMPEVATQNGDLTQYQFVGPDSTNSGLTAWNKDKNNFAPHVGFAWQLPWFGKGKTTLRGGYSISYSPITNFDGYAGVIAKVPGTTYSYSYTGNVTQPYVDLTDLSSLVPLTTPTGIEPLSIRPVTNRSDGISAYDNNIRNPYVQSLNLSLTRNFGNSLTFDVRYIATLSRKSIGGTNLNSANYINNDLINAFVTARAGGESALLDAMIQPGTLYYSFAGTSGAQQLRNASYPISYYLATGNFSALASSLATTNGILPVTPGVNGSVLRRGHLLGSETQLPENFIYTNPQFSSATLLSNVDHSNYHSMQAQVTMRPARGLSFQTTYTWSRNLATSGMTDFQSGERDYYLSGQHRSHQLTSYGTFDMPFGANGFIFRNASGILKKAVEGWQLSWVASMTSGLPGSVTGGSRLWGNSNPDLVRPDLWDNKAGKVTWADGAAAGYFYGDKYKRVADPQCAHVAPSLAFWCNNTTYGLQALALNDGSNTIVFQNADPATKKMGNYAPNQLAGPGRWSLDMAMGKAIEFMEGKRIDFRVDAQNIFNHPTPSNYYYAWNARFTQIGNPQFGLNSTDAFGLLGTKGGHRTFQAKIRISF